jgi:RNA polymerase sigma-70 factor (ECF subfamily)
MTTKVKNIITQSWDESSQKLLNYITSKIHQKEDAEDILQDVYIKTISKVDSLRPDTNLNAWLFVVTKNAINDYFRMRQKHPETELTESLASQTEGESTDLEGFCCLDPHINELPEKYKKVIILSEIEGKKHQEIADQLKLSLSAIKSRVVRGRELLKDKFISCCKYHVNEAGKLTGASDCDNDKCPD